VNHVLTATATDSNGNTSSFRHAVLPLWVSRSPTPSPIRTTAVLAACDKPFSMQTPTYSPIQSLSIFRSRPHTIRLLSRLPAANDPVVIDGTTQPGASCDSWPPTLLIELDATSASDGLWLTGRDSVVRWSGDQPLHVQWHLPVRQ